MSIITCIAVVIVAGLIGLVKALNTRKDVIHTQKKEGNKELLMKNIETDNDDDNAKMENNPETWTDEYGVVFSVDKKQLIKAPKELKEYIIPEGTVSIEARAFKSSQIESVLIPNSVTRIKFGAFAWCDKLVVEIPDSVRKIDNEAFLFVKEVHCYGPLKEKGPWRAKKYITERPKTGQNSDCYIGEIPWGPSDSHNGYSQYYKGEIRNGVPHGYGSVYEINMLPYGGLRLDKLLYSGRWENGICYIGEIPWGPSDAHNGYSQYYKGEIRNGVPHGYGGVYEIDMVPYGGRSLDKLLYSGRWENGKFLDGKSPIDELTEEEWRHIN